MLNKELLLGSGWNGLRRCMNYRIEGSNESYHLGESSSSTSNENLAKTYISVTKNTATPWNVDVTFDITGLIDEVKVTDHGYILLIIGGAKSTWYISNSSGSTWYEFFDYNDPDYFVSLGTDFYYGKFLPYNYKLGGVSYLGTGKFRIKNGDIYNTDSYNNYPGIVIGGYIRRPDEYTSLGNFALYQNGWVYSNFPTLRTDAGLEIYTD